MYGKIFDKISKSKKTFPLDYGTGSSPFLSTIQTMKRRGENFLT